MRALGAAILGALLVALGWGPLSVAQSPPPTNGTLWQSLYRFEGYVAKLEDPTFGYRCEDGYPMYLQTFADMYLSLYRRTGNLQYKARFLRAVLYALKAGDSYLWRYASCWFPPPAYSPTYSLYNALFAELFVDAWRLTGEAWYLEAAQQTVYAFLHPQLYGGGIHGVNDWSFMAFAAIATYAHATGDRNEALMSLAQRLYAYSLAHYDTETGRWYYNLEERRAAYYDARAAYYQTVDMLYFLKSREAIRAVFPSQYRQLAAYMPTMKATADKYILSNATMYYTATFSEYTEAAGQVLWLYQLYDNMYGTDHAALKEAAKRTLLERQAPNGGYYPTARYQSVEVWYTDGVGWALGRYLWLTEALPNRLHLPKLRVAPGAQ